jgi:hypothetical protein
MMFLGVAATGAAPSSPLQAVSDIAAMASPVATAISFRFMVFLRTGVDRLSVNGCHVKQMTKSPVQRGAKLFPRA